MSKIHAYIEQLEQRLRQLIVHGEEQRAKLQELQQENEQLRKMLHIQGEQAAQRSKEINGGAIRQWLREASGAHKDKMLSRYIGAIDECITFLEKL